MHLKSNKVCIIARSTLALLLFKGLATKHTTIKWTILELTADRKQPLHVRTLETHERGTRVIVARTRTREASVKT